MPRRTWLVTAAGSLAAASALRRQLTEPTPGLPNIGFRADSTAPRTECGVGALMPWAESLWAITYNSHTHTTGTGLGLYRIDDRLRTELVHKHDSTHAKRNQQHQSSQVFIGPYAIDAKGAYRFIDFF